MPGQSRSAILAALALALVLNTCAVSGSGAGAVEPAPFAGINHFVVIYTENRSLDGLFGTFPGADGLAEAAMGPVQVDTDGTPLAALPPVWAKRKPDGRFPAGLPNAPFDIGRYVGTDGKTPDLVHRFYQQQEQINHGRNDRFVAVSDAGGLAMGYYEGDQQQLWEVARRYTLADHFHQAAFGGSFLNHIFLICACAPVYPNAPPDMVAALDPATGWLVRDPTSPKSAMDGPPVWKTDGAITPDGYAVNTLQPPYKPYSTRFNEEQRLPPQTMPTIGDRLAEKGISWAWYGGGWAAAEAGKLDSYAAPEWFMPHHQPFNYFAAYAPGTPARAAHLKDGEDFMAAVRDGTLPAVAFYKPIGRDNLHPGYTDLASGDRHVAEVVAAIEKSPNWKDTAVIITADENGGTWDHVAPPATDRFGPGSRVSTIIVSPLARKGHVDHTVYDTTSILRTIEVRFGLAPLTARDAGVADLRNAFEAPTN